MDVAAVESRVEEGTRKLGLELAPGVAARLSEWAKDLLKWNERVNLTAITRPDEVAEKHLIDSLAVLPEVEKLASLLDLGTGAGLPGIPLAVALPSLEVTLVDAVFKKVGFLKAAAAKLQLAPRVKSVHLHAEGRPDEGLGVYAGVISRAFADPKDFLPLALHYLAPEGQIVAMLGRRYAEADLQEVAGANGLRLHSLRTFALPFSQDPRGVAVFER